MQQSPLFLRSTSATRIILMLSITCLAILVSACGNSGQTANGSDTSSQQSSGTTAPINTNMTACMLVTTAEMSQIVGGHYKTTPSTVNPGVGQTQCEYDDASGGLTPIVDLTTHDSGTTWSGLSNLLTSMPDGYKKISGVGDEAIFQSNTFHVLWVLKGSTIIQTTVNQLGSATLDANKELSLDEQIAQAALKQL